MPFMNGGHIYLILLLVIVLVIFGPKRLPELGSSVGKAISEFRRSTSHLKDEFTASSTASASPRAETTLSNADAAKATDGEQRPTTATTVEV